MNIIQLKTYSNVCDLNATPTPIHQKRHFEKNKKAPLQK